MGKIVKYCSSCDEGFGERFTFCPDCGASLQAFELNPVTGEPQAPVVEEPAPTAPSFISETPAEPAPTAAFAPQPADVPVADQDVDLEYDDSNYDYLDVEEEEAPAYAAAADTYAAAATIPVVLDEDYHVTVIQEDNGQRNGLLLGATIFMVVFVCGLTVYSLFIKPLDVGAIGDDTSLAFLAEVDPVEVEEVEKKKDKDDAGGGGGGGKQEKTPASLGDLANQTKNPIRPPDANTPRLENPSLVLPPASTQGNMTFPPKYNKYGLPNGLDGLSSNGTGSGGGLGNGYGTGQGNGTGTGAGNGNGSGYGNGNGNGNGNGDGDGNGGGPPPAVEKVSTPYKILFKPKATYTDQARTNNVQGSVTLKITLMANGSVGSITPVTRLPYGLTEQAIAAARQIKFEPKKINGQPVSVTVTFQYGFNIY